MLERDNIFFGACGLCAVGAALALLGNELALLLFVAAYLLRPTLHELGLGSQLADERQLAIHARSGNISFIVVILAAVGFALWRVSRGERADQFYELICIGLAARAIAGLVMGGEYRKAGAVILGAIGVFLGLFIILESGFTIGAIAGVVVAAVFVGIARLAMSVPRVITFILIMTVVALVVADLHEFRSGDTALWLFLVTPLAFSSACLLLGSGGEDRTVSPRLRTAVFGSLAVSVAVVFTLLILVGDRGNEDRIGGATSSVGKGEIREIQGVPCTGMIDIYRNGNLKSCTLAHDSVVAGQMLPAETVVSFTSRGRIQVVLLAPRHPNPGSPLPRFRPQLHDRFPSQRHPPPCLARRRRGHRRHSLLQVSFPRHLRRG